jgi:signal transduction histidine kinase
LLLLNKGEMAAQQPAEMVSNLSSLGTSDTIAILKLIQDGKQLRVTSPDSAILLLRQASSGSSRAGYTKGLILSHIYIGECLVDKKAYKIAREQYHKAMGYCGPGKTYVAYRAFIHTEMGDAYQFEEDMVQAVDHYRKAAQIAEMVKDTIISLSRIYNNLGYALITMGQYEKAIYYLDQAEYTARKANNNQLLGNILLNKGVAYGQQENPQKGDYYFRAARAHAIKYHYLKLQQVATANLGKILIDKGRHKEAIAYLKEALTLAKPNDPGARHIRDRLGMAYFRAKDYAHAAPYLQQSLANAQMAKEPNTILAFQGILGDFYTKTKQYSKANEHLYAYIKLYDSVKNNERLQQANKLETQYRTALKDKELSQKQLQINRQKGQIKNKNLWIAGSTSGLLLLTLLIALLYILYRNSKQKQKQEQQIQEHYISSLQKDNEINRLKALMEGEEKERTRLARELHDGIGGMLASTKMNLGTLRAEHSGSEPSAQFEAVMRMLTETASEVRKTAHNLMPDVLMRYDLEKALRLHADGINTSNLLQIDLEFYGPLNELNKAMELIVYRMAQELIQNIIKHANASSATVAIMLHENRLSITAEDNGTGFNVSKSNMGFGLLNLRHRVEALHGNIDIQSAEESPTVIFIVFDFTKFKEMTL